MAELKTKPTDDSVTAFLDGIPDEARRRDCYAVLKLMKAATKAKPRMWGSSIVGFGTYRCQYASGRELDWFLTGFSPRKQNLTLYVMPGLDAFADLLATLGKHTTGKSCLYVKSLADIDLAVLKQLVARSVERLTRDRAGG